MEKEIQNQNVKKGNPYMGFLWGILIVLVLNGLIFPMITERKIIETDYGTFIAKVESGTVKEVMIKDGQIYFNADEVEKIPDNGQEWKAWPSTHPAHGEVMLTRFYFNDRLNVMLGHYDDNKGEWVYFFSGDCPPTTIHISQVYSGLVKGFFYRNPDLLVEKEECTR